MAIQPNGTAPYAPASTVIDLIERFRSHGLQSPFTLEVLLRAGVPESLAPRTLTALKLLDLIDETGKPTPDFILLQEAPSDQYKIHLATLVRMVYADVFSFADPASDPPERIEDAFRSYQPRGQRARMVTLFMGLCQLAGITEGISKRVPAPGRPSNRVVVRPVPRQPINPGGRTKKVTITRAPVSASAGPLDDTLPAAITALVNDLATRGQSWTEAERDTYMAGFKATVDIYYPVRSKRPMGELLPAPLQS
jgi:hypothetical protein